MEINNSLPTRQVEPESENRPETDKLKKNQTDVEFMSYLLGLPNGIPEPKTPEIDAESMQMVEVEIPIEESTLSGDLQNSLVMKEATASALAGKAEAELPGGITGPESETLAELMEASQKEISDLDVEKGIQKYLESATRLADEGEQGADAQEEIKSSPSLFNVASGSPTASDYTEVSRVVEKPAVAENSLQRVFEGVQALVHRGGGKMTVSLSPEHLGQMEIEVNTKGKSVTVEMVSQSHAAKEVIESQLADLKTAMQSQDLILSRVQVQVGNEGHWASDKGEGRFQQPQDRSAGTTALRQLGIAASNPVSSGMARLSAPSGRLDLRI